MGDLEPEKDFWVGGLRRVLSKNDLRRFHSFSQRCKDTKKISYLRKNIRKAMK